MTAPVLQFRVAGTPVTQGSKKAILVKGRPTVVDDDPHVLKRWRDEVDKLARAHSGPLWEKLTGPVRVDLWFAIPKPMSTPKRRRTWPVKRGSDVDKLARAVLDALDTADVYGDDSQVVELRAVKGWPAEMHQTGPGVLIRVWRVDDSPPPPSSGQIPLLAQPIPGGDSECQTS